MKSLKYITVALFMVGALVGTTVFAQLYYVEPTLYTTSDAETVCPDTCKTRGGWNKTSSNSWIKEEATTKKSQCNCND